MGYYKLSVKSMGLEHKSVLNLIRNWHFLYDISNSNFLNIYFKLKMIFVGLLIRK